MDAHVMKIKGLNKLDVGNKTLVLNPETRKKNPNILRFLLGFIINVEFGGIREKAAERFGSLGDVYASRRSQSGMNSLSYSVIGDILNDRLYDLRIYGPTESKYPKRDYNHAWANWLYLL